MTFDPTKPCMTRDGRKARIICTDAKGWWPIVALAEAKNGSDEFVIWAKADGTSNFSATDLINVPETKSWWVNVYETTLGDICHESISESDKYLCKKQTLKGRLEIRMCDGKHVETIQHEVEK